MTISKQKGPEDGMMVLEETLLDLDAASVFRPKEGGRPIEFRVMEPLPVYVLGLTDAANGSIQSGAKHTGWRYLLDSPSETDAIVDLDVERNGRAGAATSFNRISEGEQVGRFVKALRLAGKAFEKAVQTYEARALDVPSLNLSAIWLEANGESIFIPYLYASRLKRFEPKVDPDFPKTLQQKANELLDSDLRLRGA